jgi:phosphate transport system substrate-binding protein
MRRRFGSAAALTLALALAAGACGTDDNTAKTSGAARNPSASTSPGADDAATLTGAGSTFAANIVQEWIKQYRSQAPKVVLNYQPVGSGAGIQQLTSKTVDFAGSDVPLKDSEVDATGGPGAVVQIPWTAGWVAVEYNLPGVKDLRLSPAALAGIFAGTVSKWNDPVIKTDNPTAALPGSAIQVVHRSDGSGTTQVLTDFMKAAVPGTWTFPGGKDWPAGTAGTGAKGSDGVTAAVKQSAGSIGYAELSFPKQAGLGVAAVGNKAGRFVAPTAKAVTAALAGATVNADATLKLNFTPDSPDAYPISTTSYLLFYKSGADPAKDTALKHFAAWALLDGQKAAESLDYAPLPPNILGAALGAVKL